MTKTPPGGDRPRAPRRPDAPTTAVGRHGQQLLLAIHHHLRMELAEVAAAVQHALADSGNATAARALINDMTMRVNYRRLGSFCGQYCQVVAMHHRIEDRRLFVDLADADPDLRPVLDRLSSEHHAIHDILMALDQALLAMLADEAAALPAVADAVARLQEELLSHLDYEEQELLPALGRLHIQV